jgi:hypothetical protein
VRDRLGCRQEERVQCRIPTRSARSQVGEELLTVAGDGDTTVADLVGEYTQTPKGRYVFVHGPLVRALREGLVLFIDDATLCRRRCWPRRPNTAMQ